MKRIIYVSTLFLSLVGYAQKPQINFDNILEYNLKSSSGTDELNDFFKVKMYQSISDKVLLFEAGDKNLKTYSILKDGKYLTVGAISLDRTINLPSESLYLLEKDTRISNFFNSEIVLEKIHLKGEYNGRACDFYKFIVDVNATNNDFLPVENTCLCVDENSNVKNLKALFPNANIDGLILSYAHLEHKGEEFSLIETKKTNIKIDFDFDENYKLSLENYTKYKEEFETENQYYATDTVAAVSDSYYNNYYNDPLCNGYQYFDDLDENTRNYALKFYNLGCDLATTDSDYDSKSDLTREQAIQIAKKQSEVMIKQGQKSKLISKEQTKLLAKAFEKLYKEAEAFVPVEYVEEGVDYTGDSSDWAVESVVDYGYRNYSSDYKSMQIDVVNLAAESQFDEVIKNYMPDYCSDLKNNIPNFSNQDLKTHVYNLVGQICDLYLYQNGGSVDYFVTIDSMRKSLLEIDNMRNKLSKNDIKLLNEYLNSLD